MTWRCTNVVTDSTLVPDLVVTGGRCRGAPKSVEPALYFVSTSCYDFLSMSMTTTEVPGFQCVSANNIPRS